MSRVLIVDDDPLFCDVLGRKLDREGYPNASALTLTQALDALPVSQPEVVFLDVHMPDGNGLELIPQIKALPHAPEVIIVTGMGDPDGAELAIRHGAWDYIEKGDPLDAIVLALVHALQFHEEKSGARSPALDLQGVVATSARMKECFALLGQAARSDANVLVLGETGTGKELLARAIHRNSRRANGNFVVVDCAALPETLVESTLFGHRKGAFTGAVQDRPGLIRQADGGTLFLDEVGELPLPTQKAFLRVLQERRFTPVGSDRDEESDFRLVAATNRDLPKRADEGLFRQDLLYRLQAFTITLPPLRERAGDVPALARRHVKSICERFGGDPKAISPDFLECLEAYDWPGNVRELLHCLDRSIAVACDTRTLFPIHLPVHVRAAVKRTAIRSMGTPPKPTSTRLPASCLPLLQQVREAAIREVESHYLRQLAAQAENDVQRACEISGLGRSRLYGLLKRHGLSLSAA